MQINVIINQGLLRAMHKWKTMNKSHVYSDELPFSWFRIIAERASPICLDSWYICKLFESINIWAIHWRAWPGMITCIYISTYISKYLCSAQTTLTHCLQIAADFVVAFPLSSLTVTNGRRWWRQRHANEWKSRSETPKIDYADDELWARLASACLATPCWWSCCHVPHCHVCQS